MRRTGVLTFLGVLLSACGAEASKYRDALSMGWFARLDEIDAKNDPVRFAEIDGGLEVKPGANATLWREGKTATGAYRLSTEVTHLDSGLHPHGAGLAFGGTHIEGDAQAYTYFLVRGDGQFLIKTRDGAETGDVVSWTPHDAVSAEDAMGTTENRLSVEVGTAETRFLVNGSEVHRAANAVLHTEGRYGYRLVHDLHVLFGQLRITRY